MYSIRAVDVDDDEVAEILGDLHQLTFLDSAALPQFGSGSWWLAYDAAKAVAFAGAVLTADISAE
jgi:hypothetical protein